MTVGQRDYVAVGYHNQFPSIWDLKTGNKILVLETTEPEMQDFGGVEAISYSPDGKTLLLANDEETSLWDASTGKRLRKFASGEDESDFVGAVAFSPNGKQILTGGTFGAVRLWDVATGKPERSFAGPKKTISRFHLVPTENRFSPQAGTIR